MTSAYLETRMSIFEDSYIPEPNSGCWLWVRALTGKGYGQFWISGPIRAHRAAWVLYRGEIPEGMLVCHRCDIPSCVNPDHLFLGTMSENANDSVKKKRHCAAKLTDAQVSEILASNETQKKLSKRYGVNETQIQDLRSGRTYLHVPRPRSPQ